ncbi:hypothetical protein OPT61_g4825 [Boeremia exigua]|uniref:Uncharacterized protein n=1 Tax=Boeremia exigua TaxID=749465 RepID=A0ACC2ICI1_9PLEO|nr:hypothetical protein OPT61_g4825 [Boeremia exigua]
MEDYASASGFTAILDLKNEWAGEWARALVNGVAPGAGAGTMVGSVDDGVVKLRLGDVRPRLPIFTIGKRLDVVKLHLLVDRDLDVKKVSINAGSSGSGSGDSSDEGPKLGGDLRDVQPLRHYASDGGDGIPFGDQWIVELGKKEVVKGVAKCVLLVEYALAK